MNFKYDKDGFLIGQTIPEISRDNDLLTEIRNDVSLIKTLSIGNATKNLRLQQDNVVPINKPSRSAIKTVDEKVIDRINSLKAATDKVVSATRVQTTAIKQVGYVPNQTAAKPATQQRDETGRFVKVETRVFESKPDKEITVTSNKSLPRGEDGRFLGRSIDNPAIGKLTEATLATTDALEAIDPAIRGMQEIATPLAKGYQMVFSGTDSQERWLSKIFKTLNIFKKESGIFHKHEIKTLENLEGGSGGSNAIAIGLGITGLAAVLEFLNPIVWLGKLYNWFTSENETITKFYETVSNIFNDITQTVETAFNDINAKAKDLFSPLINWLDEKINGVKKVATNVGNKVAETASKVDKKIEELTGVSPKKAYDETVDFMSRNIVEPVGKAYNDFKNSDMRLPSRDKGQITRAEAMTFFMKKGWSKEAAAGIVSNLEAESGLQANGKPGDGGEAIGMGQWHKPRQSDFKKAFGKPLKGSLPIEQLEFVHHELTKGEDVLARKAGRLLRGNVTAKAAGSIVSKLYERPAAIEEAATNRSNRAQAIYSGFKQPIPKITAVQSVTPAKAPTMPAAPLPASIAESPVITEPLNTIEKANRVTVSINQNEVGQNLSDTRIARLATGGFSEGLTRH